MADRLFRIIATALTLQERYSLVNACNFMVCPAFDFVSYSRVNAG